jgi:hypothetical protein
VGFKRSWRLPRQDRAFLGVTVCRVFGPVAGLDAERLRAALVALHEADPTHPAVCALSTAPPRWRRLTAERFAARPLVLRLGDDTPDTPDELARYAYHHLPLGDRPLLFAMRGQLVVAKFAHVLGSGDYLNALVADIVEAAAQRRTPRPPRPGAARFALTRATLRHLRRDPGAPRRLARLPRPHPAVPEESRPVRDYAGTLATRSARTGPGGAAGLRAWRDKHAPGTSLTAVLTAGLTRALRHVGLEPDAAGVVLLTDLHRYLPAGRGGGRNFVVGQYLAVPDPGNPFAVHRVLHEALAAGRPLAGMALRLLRAPRVPPVPGPAVVGRRPRVILSVSRLDAFANLPWAVPVDQVRHVNISTISPPDAISVSIWELSGVLHAAASFHAEVFDPRAVGEALDLLLAEPIGGGVAYPGVRVLEGVPHLGRVPAGLLGPPQQ